MRRFLHSMTVGRLLVLAGVAVFAIASRLVPHAPGFVAVTATALFAGFFFRSRVAGALAVVAVMAVSDMLLPFDTVGMRVVVYGSLLLPVFLGALLQRRAISGNGDLVVFTGLAGLMSMGSSLFFYATTNLAFWAWSDMYAHTVDGLALCYVAALPFLKNGLAGDLFYTTIFFSLYGLAWLVSRRSSAVTA